MLGESKVSKILAGILILLVCSKVGMAQSLPFYDNFNSGNINNWQVLWTNFGSNPDPNVAFNNQTMNITTHDATEILVYNGAATWSGYSIEVDAKVTQLLEDAAGMIRIDGYITNPHIAYPHVARNSYQFALSTRDDTWEIWKYFEDGTYLLLNSGPYTCSINVTYNLRAEMYATGALKLWVNGAFLGQALDSSPYAGGMVGLGGGDDVVEYDNLEVEPLSTLPFHDDFNAGNVNNWLNLWTNFGVNPDPVVSFTNGIMSITTHDASEMFVYNGSTEWANYRINCWATVTQLLEDAAGMIRIDACVTNPHIAGPHVVRNSYQFALSTRDDTWEIWKYIDAGTYQLKASGTYIFSVNVTYHIRVEVHASGLLKLYVNNSLIGQYTDPVPLTSGMVALGGGDDVVQFDNFEVEAIQSPLWVDLTAMGNTTLPTSGGTLLYNIAGGNIGTSVQTADIWCGVTLPTGGSIEPVMGPVQNFPFAVGFCTNRDRSLIISGNAPSGTYTLDAYFGDYNPPNNVIVAEDHLTFYKTGADAGIGSPAEWFLDSGESFAGSSVGEVVPNVFEITSSPNPFNPATTLTYTLPAAARVKLSIFDIWGRQIATLVDGFRDAGVQEVYWDATGLPSGVYCARLESQSPLSGETGSRSAAQKLVLLK